MRVLATSRTALEDLAAELCENTTALVEKHHASTPGDLTLRRTESIEDARRCIEIAQLVQDALSARSSQNQAKVLEVGIGYLSVTTALRHLLGNTFDLFAVEHPHRDTLQNPIFHQKLAHQAIEFETIDIISDSLPWAGVAFDAIILADVIEHLSPTLMPGVLAQLATRLTSRGRLVIASPNLPALCRIASLALGRGKIFDPPVGLEWAGDTYGHLRLYGRIDIETVTRHVGLEIVTWRFLNWEHVFLPRHSVGWRLLHRAQRHLPGIVPRLATSWVFAAHRRRE